MNAQVLNISGTVTPGTASAITVDIAGAPDTAVGAAYNVTITAPTDLTIDGASVTQSVKNVTNTTLIGDAETGTVRWSGNLTELSGAINSSEFFATGLSLKNDFESAITNQLDFDDIAVNPSGCDDAFWGIPVDSHNVQIADQLIETIAISTNGLVVFNYTDEDTLPIPLAHKSYLRVTDPTTSLLRSGPTSCSEVIQWQGWLLCRVANGDENWFVIEWWNAVEWSEAGSSAEDLSYTFSLWMKENRTRSTSTTPPLACRHFLCGVEDGGGASGISYYFSGTGEAPTENSSPKSTLHLSKGQQPSISM